MRVHKIILQSAFQAGRREGRFCIRRSVPRMFAVRPENAKTCPSRSSDRIFMQNSHPKNFFLLLLSPVLRYFQNILTGSKCANIVFL